MDVDPRAGVLSDGLDDGSGFADNASRFGVVAEDTVSGRRHRVGVRLRRPCVTAAAVSVISAAAAKVVVVIVVARFRPSDGISVIVLVIVIVPLRSRSLH